MQVEWARHGQNVANLTRTLSHRVFDGSLTSLGHQQAVQLATALSARAADARPALLVCSPMRRARQTAEVISTHLGLPISFELEDLRELDVGELDGRADETSWAIYNHVLSCWRSGETGACFPDGENCLQLCQRLRRALATVAAAGRGMPVLIVAHGASLRAALPYLTGTPDPGCDLRTGGIARLEVGTGPDGATSVSLVTWGVGAG
jgi:probable phosphoglycerate mutase